MLAGVYQVEQLLDKHLSVLSPAQRQGLALWVSGSVLAGSACQDAVARALEAVGRLGAFPALRQRLREWLYDGADKACGCRAQVEPSECFADLAKWVRGWWRGRDLVVALDATNRRDELTHLVLSVLYRGTAVPVAWRVLPQRQRGSWLPAIETLVEQVAAGLPTRTRVLFLADAGLWSRQVWRYVRRVGWHPLVRINAGALFAPDGGRMLPVSSLVRRPGTAWVGHGMAFSYARARLAATLVAVWAAGYEQPWYLLCDLPARQVGVYWYGMRMWVEQGFRVLKSFGWHLERTRRTDPRRAERHWLVLAVATLCTLAVGTRAEEGAHTPGPPGRGDLQASRPADPARRYARTGSVFAQGLCALRWMLTQGRLLRTLCLRPGPWPQPPGGLIIVYHAPG